MDYEDYEDSSDGSSEVESVCEGDYDAVNDRLGHVAVVWRDVALVWGGFYDGRLHDDQARSWRKAVFGGVFESLDNSSKSYHQVDLKLEMCFWPVTISVPSG